MVTYERITTEDGDWWDICNTTEDGVTLGKGVRENIMQEQTVEEIVQPQQQPQVVFVRAEPVVQKPLIPSGVWLALACAFVGVAVYAAFLLLALAIPPKVIIGVTFLDEVTGRVQLPVDAFKDVSATTLIEIPVQATSQVQLPDGVATGRVSFLSLENGAVTFQAGRVLATVNGVNYTLRDSVTVPGAGNQAGSAEGVVVADKPGEAGNLPGGFGARFGFVKVAGGPVAGGSMKSVNVVSADDLARARVALSATANDKAAESVTKVARHFTELDTKLEYQLPAEGSQGTQIGRVTATYHAKSFDPESIIAGVKLDASDIMAAPEFKTLEGDTLIYSRKVDPALLLAVLNGWRGDKSHFLDLMSYLKSLPAVTGVRIPDLSAFNSPNMVVAVEG
jgi:uncharacterized protein YdhG (YjbR/CyaY superfamily)